MGSLELSMASSSLASLSVILLHFYLEDMEVFSAMNSLTDLTSLDVCLTNMEINSTGGKSQTTKNSKSEHPAFRISMRTTLSVTVGGIITLIDTCIRERILQIMEASNLHTEVTCPVTIPVCLSVCLEY